MMVGMKGILFDLDGVLYNSEEPIAGATDVLSWARGQSIPHLFVTNTTSRGRDALVAKLARFGIETDQSQILTPCVAAAEWLRKQEGGPIALFVRQKAHREFEGLELLPSDAGTGARYVVIGDLGDAWDFRALNRAFRLLHSNPESILIALGMTRFWHAHDGLRLDTAPFVVALQHATGKEALVFGKPAAPFYHAAVERLRITASEIVMVGDGIDTDIEGAQKAGLKGVLVRTGKFRLSDLEGTVKPDAVLNSIRDLPDWWSKQSPVASRQ
jgi:phospholysine phosphohistidine inorganic pyrophosphate phosphatase